MASHRSYRAVGPVWGQVFERELEERKIGWLQATTVQRERLIAGYLLTLQP
jgi:hypothetical protein